MMQIPGFYAYQLNGSSPVLREVKFVAFLLFLPLIVMPLDGEEHAYAEYENLERSENYRNPIHNFKYFLAIT